jgi:hypothetical protein
MKFSMPLVDLGFLSQLTGQDMLTGAVNVPKRQILTASAGNTVTLASTPVSGTLKVYLLDGSYGTVLGRDYGVTQTAGTPASTVNTYSVANSTVLTLNATTAPENTKIICEYDYAAPATTRTITFRADRFVGYFALDGFGLVTDQVTGAQRDVIFNIRKAKPKNDFTITMKSDAATVLEMDFDLYTTDELDSEGNVQKVYLTLHDMV